MRTNRCGILLTAAAAVLFVCPQLSQAVELFAAKEEGQVDVRLIPKDSSRATVLITNNTDQPLTLELPEVFAGVPVLAQLGIGGGGGRGGGGGGSQGVGGGGLGGGGGGRGGGGGGFGGGGGGGAFNVDPGQVRKVRVPSVCLEHGKDEPNPRMEYDLVPVETLTSDPKVVAILELLGRGQIDQVAAQAAAWHLKDGLSWQQLAEKVKVQHLNGTREMYFNGKQLTSAMQIVTEATRRAALSDSIPASSESVPTHRSPSSG